jgi:hypothetical protein
MRDSSLSTMNSTLANIRPGSWAHGEPPALDDFDASHGQGPVQPRIRRLTGADPRVMVQETAGVRRRVDQQS